MMLEKGDTIGIIALSGNCEREKIERAKANLEELGYKVKLSANIFSKNRYLAGDDDEKAAELKCFFEDSEIKLILAARGGYGAIRLVDKIDYDVIKNNPKMFCGFSDVTALLLMIYKKAGLVTYHSPMACSDFGVEELSQFTIDNFFGVINNEIKEYYGFKIYKDGKAEGILWGGNLATVVSLCGQDFLPDEDFIFFAEDLNEPVYKIDRMFHQLINISDFRQKCKAIVFGDFLDVDNEEWLEELFIELGGKLDIPIVSGYKITHARDKITLQIGVKASLDGDKLFLH